MRWLSYFILAYVAIAVQMGLNGLANWGQASPNFVLPVVVFIAINASREEALVGAFLLGVMQDLFTVQPPGLYAFSYGLFALFVVGAQPSLYRDHPLTHGVMTLAGGLLTGTVVAFNEWTYPLLHRVVDAPPVSLGRLFGGAFYTALLAPVLLFPLVRGKRLFAFRGSKSHYSGLAQRA